MLTHNQRHLRLRRLCLTLFLLLLAACSSGSPTVASPSPVTQKTVAVPSPVPSPSPTKTGPSTPGLKSCRPASPIDNSPVGPEVQGTATNAQLWALIQSTSGIPPVAKTQVKIVWRMTASDGFTIVALGPSGLQVSPSQGPTRHTLAFHAAT